MILAPTLTLNSVRGPSVDPDAAAFAAASGATDVAALSEFVKGVKALGLWSNMVCWPLRSTQNAGTGTTAYSLGGLGTFNGTLVNGPTWGTSGTAFTTTQFANASITALPQDVTLLFCGAGDGSTHPSFPHFFGVQDNATQANNQIAIGGNSGPTSIGTFHRNSTTAVAHTGNGINPFNAATSFAFVSGTAKVADLLNYRNVSTPSITDLSAAATAGTANLNRMQLNGRWAGSLSLGVNITVAFAAIVTPNINGSEATVYTLYKNTLGTGLGLP